jgi:glycosyltransferase involved in cell wall biosynthesis
MDTVQVLLSTYNGERYLAELIESLLQQDYPNTEILVRDDGSTDGTVLILSQYAAQGRLRLVKGRNVGVPSSYFELLALSSEEAAFCAFCDQDDVWNRDKLSRAVAQLKGARQDHPVLYCTAVDVVNEELGNIGRSAPLKRPLGFRNALVQNVATGLHDRAEALPAARSTRGARRWGSPVGLGRGERRSGAPPRFSVAQRCVCRYRA